MPLNTAAESGSMSIYRERAHLVAFLTTLYPSVGSYNDPEEPDFCVVYVESPVGQLRWHIHPDDMDLFEGLRIVEHHQWDGHTTDEKYQKLKNFTQLRQAPLQVLNMDTPGRKKLDALLGDYDSRHVVASLRS